jgi:Protein of unknown function (DUF4012)
MRRFWFHKEDEVRPDALIKVIKSEPKDEALEKVPPKSPRRPPLPKGIAWGIAGLVALFVVGFIVAFYVVRGQVQASLTKDVGTLAAGVQDLQNLDPAAAAQQFSSLKDLSPSDFGTLFGALGFAFNGVRNTIGSFADIANQLTLFSQELNDTASSSFAFFLSGNGGPFIADLSQLRDTIGALQNASDQLSAAALNGSSSFYGGALPPGGANSYLALRSELQNAKGFLDAFIPWLSSPTPHHLLVLLQNPSEIRPAGGFLGSYADLTIASGSVQSVDVRDIADVDASFTGKIVPPKPLQVIVSKWRPADANWFFDFPTSASETISFFDASGLYAKSSTTFDGAIAVSPKVVSDLLTVTGPIAVGKPATTFTADNFLVTTQEIVQQGQASSATYPKQILRDLTATIFTQLASSTDAQKQELFAMLIDWAAKKDITVYFKDPAMESFAEQYGVGGDVYALPQRFNGDYFSVVDANINGGKSDLYISSTVSYVAQIGADGTLTDHVVVTRKDNANNNTPWWYREENQNYEQIFVPPGATITNASGGVTKKITAPINYAADGYTTDPLVVAIESTEQTLYAYPGVSWHKESGKKVFSTWSAVKAGASKQFSLDYTERLFTPPAPGVQYQFVFEKQAGTSRSYSYEIDAPLGYVFAENNLASFDYQSDDPPGRLIVNLTLQKL